MKKIIALWIVILFSLTNLNLSFANQKNIYVKWTWYLSFQDCNDIFSDKSDYNATYTKKCFYLRFTNNNDWLFYTIIQLDTSENITAELYKFANKDIEFVWTISKNNYIVNTSIWNIYNIQNIDIIKSSLYSRYDSSYLESNIMRKVEKISYKINKTINCNIDLYSNITRKLEKIWEKHKSDRAKSEVVSYLLYLIQSDFKYSCEKENTNIELDFIEEKKWEFRKNISNIFEARIDKDFVYFYYNNDELFFTLKNNLDLFWTYWYEQQRKSWYPWIFLWDDIIDRTQVKFLQCEGWDNSIINITVQNDSKEYIFEEYIYDTNTKNIFKLEHWSIGLCKKWLKWYYFTSSITEPETRIYLYNWQYIHLIYDFFKNEEEFFWFDLLPNSKIKLNIYSYNSWKREYKTIDVSNY